MSLLLLLVIPVFQYPKPDLNILTIWWRRPNSSNRPARPTKLSLSTSSPPNPLHSHTKPRPTHAQWCNSNPMCDTSKPQENPAIATNKITRWAYATNQKNQSRKSSPTPSKNFYPYSAPTTIITLSSILQEIVSVWVLEDRKNRPQEVAIDRSLPATSKTWTSTLAIAKRRNTWRTRPLSYLNRRQNPIPWSVISGIRRRRSRINWKWSRFSTMKRRNYSSRRWRLSKQKTQPWRRI